MHIRTAAISLALASSLALGSATSSMAAGSGTPIINASLSPIVSGTKADYDGDGFDDLVVGSPLEAVAAPNLWFPVNFAGQINTLYGSTSGVDTPGNQAFDMRDAGVSGTPEPNDHFGEALASGDFNGDGFSDLAVGIPRVLDFDNNIGGRVIVFYGDAGGIDRAGDQLFSQDTEGIEDSSENGDQFGLELATGDFDADGRSDLAIAAPFETIAGASGTEHGVVHILYGTPTGLSAANDVLLSQNTNGISDAAESGDHFGAALASGDFNGDFVSDLAIGVPFEDNIACVDEGTVHILLGQPIKGLSASTDNQLSRRIKILSVNGDNEAAQFGAALAAGDVNGDGFDDLAVGMPGEDVSTSADAGAVVLFQGSASGGFSRFQPVIDQEVTGVAGVANPNEHFGFALTIGSFDADDFGDLVVGIPNDVPSEAGGVHVFPGSTSGVDFSRDRVFSQALGVGEAVEAGDHFGFALSTGDFNGDTFDDLVVGVPDEDIGNDEDCGAANVIYGSAIGLDAGHVQLWSQGSNGINGTRKDGEVFGSAVR